MTSPAPAPSRPRDPFRAVAAGVCGLQALALLGFVVFYLWELTQDSSDDVARVVMSALLILVFAVGIGAMARGWVRGDNWPNTPTVVWNRCCSRSAGASCRATTGWSARWSSSWRWSASWRRSGPTHTDRPRTSGRD